MVLCTDGSPPTALRQKAQFLALGVIRKRASQCFSTLLDTWVLGNVQPRTHVKWPHSDHITGPALQILTHAARPHEWCMKSDVCCVMKEPVSSFRPMMFGSNDCLYARLLHRLLSRPEAPFPCSVLVYVRRLEQLAAEFRASP